MKINSTLRPAMMKRFLPSFALFVFLLLAGWLSGNGLRAQYPFKYNTHQFDSIHSDFTRQWNDPEVEQRISMGIKLNRMGFANFRFADENGKPAKNVEVTLEQTKHEFLFGCNLFMLNGFPTPEMNRKYEDAFSSLFNMAVVPFYWSDLEPEQGKPRYTKESKFIYRRPPPDVCVEFCKKNDITPKGHLLIWHQWLPEWLPDNRDQVKTLMIKRFEELAARYGKDIKYWDAIDEALHRYINAKLPEDYVYTSMREAARVFPSDSKLDIGDDMTAWLDFHYESSPYYLMIENLILKNARVDAVGLCFQAHFLPRHQYDKTIQPLAMFRLLDQYAKFQRPIQFTQVTFGGLLDNPDAEKKHAEVVRNMYRLWFSYPNVEMINWWNLADGTASLKENDCLPGLLRKDLSPKPAYDALNNLINKEWWTNVKQNSGSESQLRMQGFYGEYKLTAKYGVKTVEQKISLTKKGDNEFVVQFR